MPLKLEPGFVEKPTPHERRHSHSFLLRHRRHFAAPGLAASSARADLREEGHNRERQASRHRGLFASSLSRHSISQPRDSPSRQRSVSPIDSPCSGVGARASSRHRDFKHRSIHRKCSRSNSVRHCSPHTPRSLSPQTESPPEGEATAPQSVHSHLDPGSPRSSAATAAQNNPRRSMRAKKTLSGGGVVNLTRNSTSYR
jgi:hypothetical protein